MNKIALTKLNPKFKNERQCKNTRCGGYFLSETPQDFCPLCREKGITADGVPVTSEDRVFTEINIGELSKRVAEMDDRLVKIEEIIKTVNKVEAKPKEFKPKKCESCGKKFTPASGNQSICHSCRDILIS